MGFWDWLRGTKPVPEIAVARVRNDPSKLDQTTGRAAEISEAWRIWREVGEIHYVTTQQARQASRLLWKLEINGEEQDRDRTDEILNVAYGKELPTLVRKMMLHTQVAGAFFLVRTRDTKLWDVLTYPAGYNIRKKLDEADIVIEVVQEDPANPQLTDSPVLASIPVARELILTRWQARAAARNRTAQLNTVLYPREGALPNIDEFESKIARVITEPLADEMSASAVVPNIIGFPSAMIEKWRTIDLTGPIDEKLADRVEQLIRQLAVILDIPREMMTGLSESNHWNAFIIQEDNWLGHIEPAAKEIGGALALGLVKAVGLADGGATNPTDLDFELVPDPSPLLKRRPAIADVLAAYELKLVSGEWTRLQIGATEEDAFDTDDGDIVEPADTDDDEAGVDEIDTTAPPELAEAASVPYLSERTCELLRSRRPRLQLAPSLDGSRGEATRADDPPAPEVAAPTPPFSTERLAGIDTAAFDSTQDLLEVTLTRTLERLGAQLRARSRSLDDETRAQIADLPNAELPIKLGIGLLPNVEQTIDDTADQFLSAGLSKIIRRALGYTRSAGIGIDLEQADQDSAGALLLSEFGPVVRAAVAGSPTEAMMWRLARRVIAIAGGNPDPAPQTAAPGVGEPETPLAGIALGLLALVYIRDTLGFEPADYRWQHNSVSDPHPVHDELNGIVYDGRTVPTATYTAYIGDHAGCRCSAIPEWRSATESDVIGAPPEGIEIPA